MALDALMCPSVTLVDVAILCHIVRTTMGHVVVVADSLLLLVPSTVAMKAFRQICPALSCFLSTSALAMT